MAFTEELYRQFGNRASQTLRTDLGYNRQESTELAELMKASRRLISIPTLMRRAGSG